MKQVNLESSAIGEAAQHTSPPLESSDQGRQAPYDETETPKPFSAEELRQISTQITEKWFLPIENNRLTLMEVDPWHVHAYWNTPAADIARARMELSPAEEDATLVLRFTDLSPRDPHVPASVAENFDVDASSGSHGCYVDLQHDANRYSAELGLRAADGHFVALTRSNEVETPRSGPSPQRDFRRQKVHAHSPLPAERTASGVELNDGLLRNLFPKEFDQNQTNAWLESRPQFFVDRIEAKAEMQSPSRATSETGSAAGQHIALEALLTATPFSATHEAPSIEASTHLVIQGRGAPHSLITLFGERVQIQADGSFTVRVPLPHGADLVALLHSLHGRHSFGNPD